MTEWIQVKNPGGTGRRRRDVVRRSIWEGLAAADEATAASPVLVGIGGGRVPALANFDNRTFLQMALGGADDLLDTVLLLRNDSVMLSSDR